MKLILFISLLLLEFSSINTSNPAKHSKSPEKFSQIKRKCYANSPKNPIFVGYSTSKSTSSSGQRVVDFSVHFVKEASIPTYNYLNMTIVIEFEDGSKNNSNIKCNYSSSSSNLYEEVENITYFCEEIFKNQDAKILSENNIKFYNDSNKVLNCNIDKSSSVDNNRIISYKDRVVKSYDIFYLKEIEFKDDEYNLKGKLLNKTDYTGKNINLNISGKVYNYTITNDSIKFNITNETYTINDTLHLKMPDDSILFFAKSGVYDKLIYPIDNPHIEVIGFSNYQEPTSNRNAKNQLFLTGTQYLLNSLEDYIKFKVNIVYGSRLRILADNQIEAYGKKNSTNQTNNYVIYDIEYPGTANKHILDMEIASDFEFSENDTTTYAKFDEKIEISQEPDLLNKNNMTVEKMEKLSYKVNPTSLVFDITTPKNLSLTNNKIAYMSYRRPFNEDERKEIICYVENNTIPYKIACSPKEYIYTPIQSLRFYVPEIGSNTRRLSDQETNRTFLPPEGEKDYIEYKYNPDSNIYSKKINSNGLSAGAIVAIVLSTVAAVAAVGIAFFFLNRRFAPPLPAKTTSDMNMVNSTAQINH